MRYITMFVVKLTSTCKKQCLSNETKAEGKTSVIALTINASVIKYYYL